MFYAKLNNKKHQKKIQGKGRILNNCFEHPFIQIYLELQLHSININQTKDSLPEVVRPGGNLMKQMKNPHLALLKKHSIFANFVSLSTY